MKNKKSLNGGYVMILMVLISVVIMVFLMMKSMTLLQKSGTDINTNNTDISEQGINGLAPIDAAKRAKNLIEQNDARAIEQLE